MATSRRNLCYSPQMRFSALMLWASGLFVLGCSSAQTTAPSEVDAAIAPMPPLTTRGLPCDVEKVLQEKCQSCHASSPTFGAPMPLTRYEDLSAAAGASTVLDEVLTRVQDDKSPMPPAPAARLSATELSALNTWKAAGAPRSSESCTPMPPQPDAGVDLKCTTDQFVKPASPWTTTQGTADQYVCYGFDIKVDAPRHITAIAPKVDNAKIVHHALLLEMPTAQPAKPFTCSSSLGVGARMVYAWAPGGGALELPPEAGLRLEGTKHYMVQMHYNNASGAAGESDASGFDLCTTSNLRANDADILAFGGVNFQIPPNPPSGEHVLTCDYTLPSGLNNRHFFGAMPHMHKYGLRMSTKLVHNATETDLGTVAAWNFDTQYWLPTNANGVTGDRITTTCAWMNNTGGVIRFGEKTSNEMCYSFTMYYPRSPELISWEQPARLANCR